MIESGNTWPAQKVSDQFFFSFKQESAWCREWGACDLGPLSTCMNYCFLLGLLVAGNLPKPVVHVVPVALTTTEKV
jgi:hypothetical protein